MDYNPSKSEKSAIFDQNAWTIVHQNHEKSAIFDQNEWTITHQNREKTRFLTKLHGL